jgi:O-antigen ligase
MQKFFYWCIRIFTIATFFVPLIVLKDTFIFPFIVPKILLFRSLVIMMFACYVLLLIMNPQKYKPRATPMTVAVMLFFLSFAISTFSGVDWYRSFWDNHERMLGLFTVLHYFLYYLVLSTVFPTWKEWRPLLYVLLGAGMIVMFLGIVQKIDPEYLLNRGSDRVASTLGNAIYYSGYGLFLFFLGAMLFFVDYTQRRVWSMLAAGASIIGFVGIFLGGTRGTMIGGFFGILVVSVLYAICLREYPRTRRAVFSLIGVGVLLVVLLFVNRQTTFVSGLPGLGRLLNTDIAHIGDNTRVMAWGVAIDAWKEKPLLGWGPNNFYYAFNKYYRPEFLRYGCASSGKTF